ncbi:hypothetical protein CLOSTMETH_00209 [[Clostridium] methylpentosum DSM 5476]|uniref:Uncharacterized protein n=1 Tax=[Clostridium] methylpentosum DSM 5476 TaxID=537013 RepID=C0E8R4_9FIRM|nr:hypothetical protein CLOSTMETH_00209 [[Clostridium] methylpentosum DSM 5476]
MPSYSAKTAARKSAFSDRVPNNLPLIRKTISPLIRQHCQGHRDVFLCLGGPCRNIPTASQKRLSAAL